MMFRTVSKVPVIASLCAALASCTAPSDASPVEQSSAKLGAAPGADLSFLVIYKSLAVPASAASDVAAAGGTFVASYPELGIVIARASTQSFVTTLSANTAIQSVTTTYGAGTSSLTSMPTTFSKIKTPRVGPPAKSGEPFAPMQWNMSMIHADQARKVTSGKKSVIVGVMDSGIDDSLPDLQGQVDHSRSVSCLGGVANTDPAAWGTDSIGHGSHVAGIIAASLNGVGVVGVAPGVTLAAVKVADDNGYIYPEAYVCGMYWAAKNGFSLVNASLFLDPWYYACPSDPAQAAIITASQRAFTFASNAGVTSIVSAGNEQQDLPNKTQDPAGGPTDVGGSGRAVTADCKYLPLELDGTIGVSALAGSRALSYYSSYGLGVIDLAAPGGDFHVPVTGNASGQILSPVPQDSFYFQIANGWNGRVGVNCTGGMDANDLDLSDPTQGCEQTYALLQGTSQAAPHVTGVAALALSRYGNLSTAKLLAVLQNGATSMSCPNGTYQPYPTDMGPDTCTSSKGFTSFFGAGQVDAAGSVQ